MLNELFFRNFDFGFFRFVGFHLYWFSFDIVFICVVFICIGFHLISFSFALLSFVTVCICVVFLFVLNNDFEHDEHSRNVAISKSHNRSLVRSHLHLEDVDVAIEGANEASVDDSPKANGSVT